MGKYIKTDERIAIIPTDKPLKQENKKVFHEDVEVSERSISSIKTILYKWPDTKHLLVGAAVTGAEGAENESGSRTKLRSKI